MQNITKSKIGVSRARRFLDLVHLDISELMHTASSHSATRYSVTHNHPECSTKAIEGYH
jgi:hypothetical protein